MAPETKASAYSSLTSESRLNVRMMLSEETTTSSSMRRTCVARGSCSMASIMPRAKPPAPPALSLGCTVTPPPERPSASSVLPLSTTCIEKCRETGSAEPRISSRTSPMLRVMKSSFLKVVVQRASSTGRTSFSPTTT